MNRELQRAIERIVETRSRTPADRAARIAVAGIDAGGRRYLTAKMAERLRARRLEVENLLASFARLRASKPA
ncbi:MAG TPA: hypothetical protein VNM15_06390 [Candidatus Binatia bacterium]|nr:hypothetical protein [Candidatus Binatia bacterium]